MSPTRARAARIVLVTGTDTDVGKTVVTAALAARCLAAGGGVHVHKPLQTGVGPADVGDVDRVQRLVPGAECSEGTRLTDPLAPGTAARREGVVLPDVAQRARELVALAGSLGERGVETLLVEGAGGLLVEIDSAGDTLRELAQCLVDAGAQVEVVVVTRAGLGTLNHTALTLEALAGLPVAGVVLGAVPEQPGLAERCNLEDLAAVVGGPLLGALPAGVGDWPAERFTEAAPGWLSWP